MKIAFKNSSVAGDFDVSDELAPFLLWLAQNRVNPNATAILVLVAEHDSETDEDEKANIRRTLDEILANTKTTDAEATP